MENVHTSSNSSVKGLLRALAGGLLGATVGYGAVAMAMKLRISPKSLSWSDCIALWLGVVFIAFGIFVFYLSSSRQRLARTLEGEDARLPATNDEVLTFRLQAVALALAGVMMLVPTFAAGSIAAHPDRYPTLPSIAFVVVAVLFLTQAAANIRIWRISDEFARGLLLRIAALTFAIGQGLLFLYAAAERLHLAPAVSSWDVITLLLTLYLAVGAGVSMRYQRH